MTGLQQRTEKVLEKEQKYLPVQSPFKAHRGEHGINRHRSKGTDACAR
jgi:hypothetical protein